MDELTTIANRLGSDKGTTTYCGHGYTRIYQRLLDAARNATLSIAEIGLMHVYTQAEFSGRHEQKGCPSLDMWVEYLPQARIHGFDIVDFTALATERIQIFHGDQGKRDDLEAFARRHGPFDLIVDDGSHASHHQQITLGALFPHLAEGGIYIIEDLHFQPGELEISGITRTRDFLRGLRHGQTGARVSLTQPELGQLAAGIRAIHFFDSLSPKWPLQQMEDALAVIVKQGSHPLLPGNW